MPLIDPALASSGCIPGSLQEHTVGKASSKSKASSGLIVPKNPEHQIGVSFLGFLTNVGPCEQLTFMIKAYALFTYFFLS